MIIRFITQGYKVLFAIESYRQHHQTLNQAPIRLFYLTGLRSWRFPKASDIYLTPLV